jgi:hypothetical protein
MIGVPAVLRQCYAKAFQRGVQVLRIGHAHHVSRCSHATDSSTHE